MKRCRCVSVELLESTKTVNAWHQLRSSLIDKFFDYSASWSLQPLGPFKFDRSKYPSTLPPLTSQRLNKVPAEHAQISCVDCRYRLLYRRTLATSHNSKLQLNNFAPTIGCDSGGQTQCLSKSFADIKSVISRMSLSAPIPGLSSDTSLA